MRKVQRRCVIHSHNNEAIVLIEAPQPVIDRFARLLQAQDIHPYLVGEQILEFRVCTESITDEVLERFADMVGNVRWVATIGKNSVSDQW